MKLSEHNRILLNVVVTYLRSVILLICGVFTGRWSLMALGEVDLGLYGLIGGLTLFISFLNTLMSSAVSRFFAINVGLAKIDAAQGLEECRKWFNTALLLHTAIPLVLVLIGYPIGIYAVNHWLTIPADRILACRWVFRFSCVSCLLGMMGVPFNGMYMAKQYIAELTMYSMISSVFHIVILYYMVSHPGIWLAKYVFLNCLCGIAPISLVAIRAVYLFPECRFCRKYLWNAGRVRQLLNYAGWQFFGNFGVLLRGQGVAILVNRYFGPAVNAANAIANNVASQAYSLSACLSGAFAPAVANAYGEHNMEKMRRMAFFSCKIGTLLILVFALPLMLEIEEVLVLWLKNPPQYVASLCVYVLAMMVLDRFSAGHLLAVNAVGKIAVYQIVMGTLLILTLPVTWGMIYCGLGVYSVGYALVFIAVLTCLVRPFVARKHTGMSIRHWIFQIVLPTVFVTLIAGSAGLGVKAMMPQSFARVVLNTLVINSILLLLGWKFIMEKKERAMFAEKVKVAFQKAFPFVKKN